MGEEFKRGQAEDTDEDTVERIDEIMDKGMGIADRLGSVAADVKTAVEKKEQLESGAETVKKNSTSSQPKNNGGDSNMDIEAQDISNILDKVETIKGGDMTVTELKEYVDENPQQINDLVTDFL